MKQTALIMIDIQNDFLPGGTLPVPRGEQVIPVLNRIQPAFQRVFATQDWHPAGHGSFASSHPGKNPGDVITLQGLQQVLWLDHCVQNTPGAALAAALQLPSLEKVFTKGSDPQVDSYSAFYDNARRHTTGLGEFLRQEGIHTLYLAGLATDYCVKYSVLDACELGFATFLITDACRGIDLHAGDIAQALKAMQQAGATLIESRSLRV